jgi:dTDP-4-dehydrorhamnose 3,5-epimerase
MRFEDIGIGGAALIAPERREDERGFFARLYCVDELEKHGLAAPISQINTGVSPRAGTLRGLHYQSAPHDEVKIVRCVRGAVFDVIVDLRPDSPTYKRWFGVELSAANGLMLHAPQGTAHGYLTLADDTELIYMTNKPYAPGAARGVRYDDPAFGIRWPAEVRVISKADLGWEPFAG